MRSALYTGYLQHRRHAPRQHEFRSGLNMLYLDLSELDTVFRGRWLWSAQRPAPVRFDRRDHLGPAHESLDESVRNLVERETGCRPQGSVCLLTHPRYFGYGFNPVSFFYCFDANERLDTIVAEVNNTPWGERHPYVLPRSVGRQTSAGISFEFDKQLHVSPFHPMEHRYHWRFSMPGESLRVHMANHDSAGDKRSVFDANLSLTRHPLDGPSMALALARHPVMTLEVIFGIHWQALRLFLKGVPFHTHPAKRPAALHVISESDS